MIFADPEFWRLLSEKIEELRQSKIDAFINGHIAPTTLDRESGYLRALLDIEAEAKIIIDNMNK